MGYGISSTRLPSSTVSLPPETRPMRKHGMGWGRPMSLWRRVRSNGSRSSAAEVALCGRSDRLLPPRPATVSQRLSFSFVKRSRSCRSCAGLHAGLAKVYQETGHADWAAIEEKEEESLPPPNCATSPAECYFVQNRYLESAKAAAANRDCAVFILGRKSVSSARVGGFCPFERIAGIRGAARVESADVSPSRSRDRSGQ